PQDLLRRLEEDGALPEPPSAPRDVPARQRSLRAVLAWSHDLLTPAERLASRGPAAFAAGAPACAPRAASAPAGGAGAPAEGFGALAALVERNLVQAVGPRPGEADEPRFALLHTARAFAWEQLVAAGEAGSAPRRLAPASRLDSPLGSVPPLRPA